MSAQSQQLGTQAENVTTGGTFGAPEPRGKKLPVAYWYLLPVILSALVFTIAPFIYTFYISFTNYHLIYHFKEFDWVGLANYRRALSAGGEFVPVLRWTVIWMVVTTILNVGGGLFLALMLNNDRLVERNLYRTILILPWALPNILLIQVWAGLYNVQGPINLLVNRLGFDSVRWLLEDSPARTALLITNLWLSYPFFMTVGLAALQAIPRDLYEVADLDGAGSWARFRDITFPFMMSAITPLLLTQLAFQFNNAGVVILLTNGLPQAFPGSKYGVTDTLATFAYKLIYTERDMGYAAAYGVFTFFIIAVFIVLSARLTGSFKEVD
jgi:arabinogalactan oligomer/maltooligosaccharide transport system permease protein